MRKAMWAAGSLLLVTAMLRASVAQACGGFFCGRLPVDQTAERIVFKVNRDSVTMITQIAYSGQAQDFAWVLPLGTVPDVSTLAVFPQRALTALDANTGPQFNMPSECQQYLNDFAFAGASDAGASEDGAAGPPAVIVHYRAEVGPYDVAAIESDDPMALYDWLIANHYNVNEVMLPYIKAYTAEGMKFLAAKLMKDKETSDIQPLQFDLPGSTPSIPLRMTALAAEPEMSILVFVFAGERYGGANWPSIDIADDRIVWKADTWPLQTNWAALVARGVDAAGGEGWATELAGSTQSLISALDNSFFSTPEDMDAGAKLRALIGDSTYLTRLYSRLSAEEMHDDPIFHRDAGPDVSNVHNLSRYVDGVDMCPNMMPISPDPCVFASCGAGGLCRTVMQADPATGTEAPVPACACIAGSTARTTFDPASVSLQANGATAPAATVVCQDVRMSFVNPGDAAAGGGTMEDPCTSFDCGEHGECLAMNMTPTCVCDAGFVAVGSFAADGTRRTKCATPATPVPSQFYGQRLPDLSAQLPGGREVAELPSGPIVIQPTLPVVEPSMDDLSSMAVPKTGTPSADDGGSDSGWLCSVTAPGARGSAVAGTLLLLLSLLHGLRRRTR